ncbi:hypothetical protein Droror1_Dr00021786 [Drosera rotundifolia]
MNQLAYDSVSSRSSCGRAARPARGRASAGIWDHHGLRTTVVGGAEGIDGDGGWTRGKRKEGETAACWGKRGRFEKKIRVLSRAEKDGWVGRVGLAVEQRVG